MFFEVAGHLGVHHCFLFELRVRVCGFFVRGGRHEERMRTARESEGSVETGSGAFGASVRYGSDS